MSRNTLLLVRGSTVVVKRIGVYVSVAVLTTVMSIGLNLLWNSLSRTSSISENQQDRTNKARTTDRKDLSDIYGRVNLTIFNKKTQTVFSTPQEFFADSGMTSFDNLKFDQVLRLPLRPRLVNGRSLTRKEIEAIQQP